jgi:hypothetical protein
MNEYWNKHACFEFVITEGNKINQSIPERMLNITISLVCNSGKIAIQQVR